MITKSPLTSNLSLPNSKASGLTKFLLILVHRTSGEMPPFRSFNGATPSQIGVGSSGNLSLGIRKIPLTGLSFRYFASLSGLACSLSSLLVRDLDLSRVVTLPSSYEAKEAALWRSSFNLPRSERNSPTAWPARLLFPALVWVATSRTVTLVPYFSSFSS